MIIEYSYYFYDPFTRKLRSLISAFRAAHNDISGLFQTPELHGIDYELVQLSRAAKSDIGFTSLVNVFGDIKELLRRGLDSYSHLLKVAVKDDSYVSMKERYEDQLSLFEEIFRLHKKLTPLHGIVQEHFSLMVSPLPYASVAEEPSYLKELASLRDAYFVAPQVRTLTAYLKRAKELRATQDCERLYRHTFYEQDNSRIFKESKEKAAALEDRIEVHLLLTESLATR